MSKGFKNFIHGVVITILGLVIGVCIANSLANKSKEYNSNTEYEESMIPVDADIIEYCFDGNEHDFNGEVSHFVTVVCWDGIYFTSYDPEMYRVVNTVPTETCRVILLKREYSDGNIEYELVGPNDG